ncbi:CopD family protein [Aminobacter anthyllidis]|uniref:Protoporphyrinogen IX oxidase n=1 Tax=Aminobacter anthyllidis TaxID=1035067 RepID=A0A9X1AFK2_9HYPH|nr:CopD family protein [Aminobacter anthyllidis]MBT1158907.1 CopD family protein [Aminobacter anthyllidis]
MSYLVIKSLHVVAMVVWLSGMIFVPLTLSRMAVAGGIDAKQATLLRAGFATLATPAMLATWGLGLYLAYDVGFFGDAWLHAKLALVMAMSGLHGVLSGQLRQLAGARLAKPAAIVLKLHWLVGLLLLGTVGLVIVKPF